MAALRYEWSIGTQQEDWDWATTYKEAIKGARATARQHKREVYVDVMDSLEDPDAELKDYHYVVSPSGQVKRVG